MAKYNFLVELTAKKLQSLSNEELEDLLKDLRLKTSEVEVIVSMRKQSRKNHNPTDKE